MIPSRITASQSILSALAADNRHVLSVWRALIYLRRATFALPASQRRWRAVPEREADIAQYIRQMLSNGDLQPIPGGTRVYRVTAPFARTAMPDIREMLFEEHAYTILSHFTALEFHGLTVEQPKVITAYTGAKAAWDLLPLGTIADDWEDVALPSATRPRTVLGQPVRWVTLDPERAFGFSVYSPLGVPYRITSPERTLIDALQKPELCGGSGNVLRAWVLARDLLDVPLIEQYTERLGIALLRQRVGYVLESIGYTSPTLDAWALSSKRGGSSKLVGSEPFASDYSERWNLSLNAPVHVLQDGALA